MGENRGEAATRTELLASVQRLTTIVLEKLDQGSKDGTLDQAQTRMLGSIALRSLRLWHRVLQGNNGPGNAESGMLEAEARLERKLKGPEGEGEEG